VVESVAIRLEGVSKSFGKIAAVRNVSLDIREGEFFSLLGPSGCGKTTTLRMIGGFEQPDEGSILLRGVDVTRVPPNRRNVNMVFQHYALFPHMSIADNVAFGLRLKKVGRGEQRERVAEMLRIVQLEGLEKRKPAQLSGGQQQRIALARALVNRPAALLLDEPLGALDVKLRKSMQLELKRIQSELGTTFVYVTHDQEEALAMSDRIGVMNGGVVEQIGPPREIYEHPATAFCADFIGSLNALDFRVDEIGDGRLVSRVSPTERLVVSGSNGRRQGDSLKLAVRPERIRIDLAERPAPEDGSRLEGVVAEVVYLGSVTQFHVDTKVGRVVSYRMNEGGGAVGIDSGRNVVLTWPAHDSSVLAGSVPPAEE
jgi:spermidine/putrescine transport system ATP-binding protein